MLDYVAELSKTLGWDLGVYPETKLSNYFSSIGLPLEEKFMKSIASHGYCGYDDSTYCKKDHESNPPGSILLQSFCPESLKVREERRATTVYCYSTITGRSASTTT